MKQPTIAHPSGQDLVAHVTEAYIEADGELCNDQLYSAVADRAGIPAAALNERSPIGQDGTPRSTIKRAIRWRQQELKALGLIERVPGRRGVWRLAETDDPLAPAAEGTRLLAFSTDLGLAIWGDCREAFAGMTQSISAIITSPPYPLQTPRAYGNVVDERAYVDWIVQALEPAVSKLVPGGSLALNVGQDIFNPGSPARSLYRERLVLALHERLGLYKLDEIPWVNKSRPPSPTIWACRKRVQLVATWEPIYWFTNDPEKLRSDNRRVLEAHTERQQALMAAGGEQRSAIYSDGAHRVRPGAFGKQTPGRIPRNVIEAGHNCSDTRRYRQDAASLGLPIHGAMMPLKVAEFLVRFLTRDEDIVADPFGGTLTTAMAAERNGRRWLVVEKMLGYLRGGAERFAEAPGFHMTDGVDAVRHQPA